MKLLTLVHILATVVWVGGMFFAHQCLRPVTVAQLEPPLRLRLWAGVFGRFFPWVWAALLGLILSGQFMTRELGGMAAVPVHVHAMAGIGYVMAAIFFYIYFLPYAALRRAVAAESWPAAAAALNRIRILVGTNLVLGLSIIALVFLLPLAS